MKYSNNEKGRGALAPHTKNKVISFDAWIFVVQLYPVKISFIILIFYYYIYQFQIYFAYCSCEWDMPVLCTFQPIFDKLCNLCATVDIYSKTAIKHYRQWRQHVPYFQTARVSVHCALLKWTWNLLWKDRCGMQVVSDNN